MNKPPVLSSMRTIIQYLREVVHSNCSTVPKVVAFGNVLLDATVQLNDLELLNKYKLSLDAKGEIDIRTLTEIWIQIRHRLMAPASCGGSALNTVRILTHLGTDCLFFGAVGKDSQADLVRGILKRANVNASLQTIHDLPTGQCMCFVYGRRNALYANIGASAKFSINYLKYIEKQDRFVCKCKKRQIFYLEGFFLPQRIDIARHIVRNYIAGKRILALNLSATYIIDENFDIMTFLVHSADLVFGNRDEFTALSNKCGFRTIEDFAKQELTQKPSSVFIITNDSKNVQLIRNHGTRDAPKVVFDSFTVPKVPVVDSTGAGDSFVAGFLHSYLRGSPLTKCIQQAISVASIVIQQVGCNLP